MTNTSCTNVMQRHLTLNHSCRTLLPLSAISCSVATDLVVAGVLIVAGEHYIYLLESAPIFLVHVRLHCYPRAYSMRPRFLEMLHFKTPPLGAGCSRSAFIFDRLGTRYGLHLSCAFHFPRSNKSTACATHHCTARSMDRPPHVALHMHLTTAEQNAHARITSLERTPKTF
jgi:hypothetical protein